MGSASQGPQVPASETPTIDTEHFKTVTLEDSIGTIGLALDGTVKKVSSSEGDKRFLAKISDCPVYIDTETVASDVTEFTFRGIGAKDHRKVCFTMLASDMAEPRKFKAALYNAFGAQNEVGSLDFAMVQKITKSTKMMTRIEAPTWIGNIPLLPGVGLEKDVEFRLSQYTPAKVYDGDIELAKKCLRAFLNAHKYSPILVATIKGTPAFARWHPNDRFGLGLWGTTGDFKTSFTQAGFTIYGVGYQNDDALLKSGKSGSTDVAALTISASAGFLPQLYDNVKTVDDKQAQQYVAYIHAVLEGGDKARGKKDGGLRESKPFSCTPIITGEIRPEEASTTARVLGLAWSKPDLKQLTYIQNNVAAMPVIGYYWLRFLAETDLNLIDGFSDARIKKAVEFGQKKYVNPGRLATIYTLLAFTWKLLCASPFGDVFNEFTDKFNSVIDEVIEMQGHTVTGETELEKFLAGIKELMASNLYLVQPLNGECPNGHTIGRWIEKGLFLLPSETLAELQKIKAFTQMPTIDSMTKALHNAGLLIKTDDKHLKAEVRMNNQKSRGWLLSPQAIELPWVSPPTGDTNIDSYRPNVSTVATSPPKNIKIF